MSQAQDNDEFAVPTNFDTIPDYLDSLAEDVGQVTSVESRPHLLHGHLPGTAVYADVSPAAFCWHIYVEASPAMGMCSPRQAAMAALTPDIRGERPAEAQCDPQVTAWETRFGTGGAKNRFQNSVTRAPDGRLVYSNPRGSLQLITQEHLWRQPKEELGWQLPENTSWEVRVPPLDGGSGIPTAKGNAKVTGSRKICGAKVLPVQQSLTCCIARRGN